MVNKGEYVRPWTRQRNLKKRFSNEDLPSIEEIAEIIASIKVGKEHQTYQTMRARALFAIYYLTGCRVSEILVTPMLRKQQLRKKVSYNKRGVKQVLYVLDQENKEIVDKYVVPHTYEGVMRKDITFQRIDGKPCMIIRAENRKNNIRKTKKLPIPIEKEKAIAAYIFEYIKRFRYPDSILFPFGAKRAQQIINHATGFNIHFIRHIRATHLVTIYDYNEQSLVKYMGWTNSAPAKHYMELKSTDLFRQFYKGDKK